MSGLTVEEIRRTRALVETAIGGYEIRESVFLIKEVQFRFPRTKSKRIRKKWAKRKENYRSGPSDDVYLMGGTIICHPIIADKIRKQCAATIDRKIEHSILYGGI